MKEVQVTREDIFHDAGQFVKVVKAIQCWWSKTVENVNGGRTYRFSLRPVSALSAWSSAQFSSRGMMDKWMN